MNLANIPDRSWNAVIEGRITIQFEFLAIQLFITRQRQRLRANEISSATAILELKNLFVKYGNLQPAQNDLAKIARI
jgi:hypothetical protein